MRGQLLIEQSNSLKQLPPTAEERHRINDFRAPPPAEKIGNASCNPKPLRQCFDDRPANERVVPPDDSQRSAHIICPILEKDLDAPRDVVSLAERVRIQAHDYFALRRREFRYSERTVSLCADYPATGPIDIAPQNRG